MSNLWSLVGTLIATNIQIHATTKPTPPKGVNFKIIDNMTDKQLQKKMDRVSILFAKYQAELIEVETGLVRAASKEAN